MNLEQIKSLRSIVDNVSYFISSGNYIPNIHGDYLELRFQDPDVKHWIRCEDNRFYIGMYCEFSDTIIFVNYDGKNMAINGQTSDCKHVFDNQMTEEKLFQHSLLYDIQDLDIRVFEKIYKIYDMSIEIYHEEYNYNV